MARKQVTREEMLKRVARFTELKPTDPKSFGSNMIPQGVSSFSVIGRGVAEDSSLQPPISDAQSFNTVIVKSMPGTGAPMHSHPTVEVFVTLNSQWVFFWGDKEEEQLTLGPWDTISFPPGVMHGFRNIGSEEGCLYAILGGTNAGRVLYEKGGSA
jgi:mannose-6-phosphate isomerase-like protein (cupin superfamily)